MTTEIVLTSTDWDPESPIDTNLAEAWSQNWISGFEGNSTTKIQAGAIDTGAVEEAKIAASAVSRGKLKTTIGAVSTGSSGILNTAPGGDYGFWISLYSAPAAAYYFIASPAVHEDASGSLNAVTLGSSYVARIYMGASTGTIYARQRYIQASPPYDLGDGEIQLFVFATVDQSGLIETIYAAPEAPWHNNGPTSIEAQRRDDVSGRSWRDALPIEAELIDAGMTRAAAIRAGMFTKEALAQRFAEERALIKSDPSESVEIEITQSIKQADMPLIPHPFTGNNLAGKSVVMLDPVSPIMAQLFELHEQGEEITDLIRNRYITVDNTELGRARPAGVMSAGISWRNTA